MLYPYLRWQLELQLDTVRDTFRGLGAVMRVIGHLVLYCTVLYCTVLYCTR